MKLIYQHGVICSKNNSSLMRLLALHELHYVVEQIIREKASNMSFPEHSTLIKFSEIIKKLHNKQTIPDKDRILDLNDDRNKAEHRNNIPSKETIQFYVRIVESFLKWSYRNYFNQNFDEIFLEDLIIDKPIKRVMKMSRKHIEDGDLQKASQRMYEGLGAFKFMLFRYMSDPELSQQRLESKGLDVDLGDILANITFKLIFGDDFNTLKKLSEIKTKFELNPHGSFVRSEYPTPKFNSSDEAYKDHEELLNIIITYQDKIPSEVWRHTDTMANYSDDS